MPTPDKSARVHYVARVVVTRVTRNFQTVKEYDNTNRQSIEVNVPVGERVTEEIANLVFSDSGVTRLANKTSKHLELIVDGEAESAE